MTQINRYLDNTQLEDGKTYTCRLTGELHLCVFEPTKWTDTQQGRIVSSFRVLMRYFNKVTGMYIDINPVNNQYYE